MLKLNGKLPRSINSFGVAGLLDENGEVLYDALFSLKHLGRVSDLICARTLDTKVDELRIRAGLLLNAFQCYRAQKSLSEWNKSSDSEALQEPIVVELGWDETKIVVGISFQLLEKDWVDFPNIKSRLVTSEKQTPFDELVVALKPFSDALVVRGHVATKRYEIVTVLVKPDQKWKIDPADQIQIVELPKNLEQTPKVQGYVELGDLDYVGLLKDESGSGKHQSKTTADSLIKIAGGEEDLALQRSIQQKKQELELQRQVIKGTEEAIADERFVVKGGSAADLSDNTVLKVSGNSADQGTDGKVDERIALYQTQMSELQKRIKDLEAELEKKGMNVTSPISQPADAAQGSSGGGFFGFFKRVFNRSEPENSEPKDTSGQMPGAPAIAISPQGEAPEPVAITSTPDSVTLGDSAAPAAIDSADPKDISKNLLLVVEGGSLDATVKRVQRESVQIKQEIKSQKGKEWVDGLVGDLISERAKIKELSKKISTSVRQKELEFRNKEKSLVEELKRRDEAMVSKEKALLRLKDQLTQSNMALERLKTASAKVGQESQFEKKYNFTKSLLASTKDENEQLKLKLDEARAALTRETSGSVSHEQYEKITAELNDTKKKSEELQAGVRELKEKYEVVTKKYRTLNGKTEEYKKRIAQAMNATVSSKQELDVLRNRLQELESENINLKRDLQSKGSGKNVA